MRIFEEDQVRDLLDPVRAVAEIERAYRAEAAGRAAISHPSAMKLRGDRDFETIFKIKGAVLDGDGDAGGIASLRIIADVDKPGVVGVAYVLLLNSRSGEPLAFVAEPWLHRVRTALTGLVTCRALAGKREHRIALIGTGRIAEQFVRLGHLVFPEAAITLASRSPARAKQAAERWHDLTPLSIAPAASIAAAIAENPIVVTVTDAKERLFRAADLRPGTLLCAMGGQYEFDAEVLEAAQAFVVDEIDFVCTAGNAAHWIASGQMTRAAVEAAVDATIGEILAGSNAMPASGTVLAIIQGMAVCDLALAVSVYRAAGQG